MSVDWLTEKHELWPFSPAERAVTWAWSEVPVAGRVGQIGIPGSCVGVQAEVFRADLSADGEVLFVLARAAWEDESQGTGPASSWWPGSRPK